MAILDEVRSHTIRKTDRNMVEYINLNNFASPMPIFLRRQHRLIPGLDIPHIPEVSSILTTLIANRNVAANPFIEFLQADNRILSFLGLKYSHLVRMTMNSFVVNSVSPKGTLTQCCSFVELSSSNTEEMFVEIDRTNTRMNYVNLPSLYNTNLRIFTELNVINGDLDVAVVTPLLRQVHHLNTIRFPDTEVEEYIIPEFYRKFQTREINTSELHSLFRRL